MTSVFPACTGRAGGDFAEELVELAPPTAQGSGQPNLTLAADRTVHLSWIEEEAAGTHRVAFSRLEPDGWSPPRTIASSERLFVNWADFPSVLRLPSGRLIAHYLERDTDGSAYHYGVRIVQSADDGLTWSSPVVPHRSGVGAEYGFVTLMPEKDGAALIWLDGRRYDEAFGGSEEMGLFYTTVSESGELGEEQVIDERVCDCCPTSVAFASGGPVAVYRDRSAQDVRDISLARRVGASWTTAPVHEDGWRINACPVNGPSVAARDDEVVVAWFTAAQSTPRVLVARSRDGGVSFGEPVRIDEGEPLGRVGVALLENGDAAAVWLERSSRTEAQVRYRRIRGNGTPTPALTVATTSAGSGSGFPRIVADANRVVLAWTVPGAEGGVRTAEIRPVGR